VVWGFSGIATLNIYSKLASELILCEGYVMVCKNCVTSKQDKINWDYKKIANYLERFCSSKNINPFSAKLLSEFFFFVYSNFPTQFLTIG